MNMHHEEEEMHRTRKTEREESVKRRKQSGEEEESKEFAEGIARLAHANYTGKVKAGGRSLQSGRDKQMQELRQLVRNRSSARGGMARGRDMEGDVRKENRIMGNI